MNAALGYFVKPALIAAGLLAMAAGTGLAFAGWIDHGPRLFMALAETGLGWCF